MDDEPTQYAIEGAPPDPSARNKAVASMILGICGIVICPLACSIPAIIFGKQAKDAIALSSNTEGAGMAQAGFIMGIIGTALGAVYAVFLLIFSFSLLRSRLLIRTNGRIDFDNVHG